MTIGKRTKCETCGSTLRFYDGMVEVHQGWWELVAEQGNHETYRAHPPERCRIVKAGATSDLLGGQLMIHNTRWNQDLGAIELSLGEFEHYVVRKGGQ